MIGRRFDFTSTASLPVAIDAVKLGSSMTHLKALLLPALSLIVMMTMVTVAPAVACSVTCGGDSCSSDFGTCSCVDGDPVCSDKDNPELGCSANQAELAEFKQYTAALTTSAQPELLPVADAASALFAAVVNQDAEAYVKALDIHREAIGSLSPAAQAERLRMIRSRDLAQAPVR